MSENVGYLEVQPLDVRLSSLTRTLWDSIAHVYLVPEKALSGKMPAEEVKKLLDSATSSSVDKFCVDEIINDLEYITKNYMPNAVRAPIRNFVKNV